MADGYYTYRNLYDQRVLTFSAISIFLAVALLFSTWVAPFGAICSSIIALSTTLRTLYALSLYLQNSFALKITETRRLRDGN